MKRMAMKIPTIVITVMMKYNSFQEIVKWAHNDTQHQNSEHPQNSPIDGDGVQLTDAQCHVVPLWISWHRETWTIQLKYTVETKQERITVLYHPTLHHGHTNVRCVCLLVRVYSNYLECSYDIWYGYNKWSIWDRPKVVRRNHVIQNTLRHLFFDLLLMGWRGCARAMRVIETLIPLFYTKSYYVINLGDLTGRVC